MSAVVLDRDTTIARPTRARSRDGGVRGWLFQYFEERVRRLFHEGGAGEDVNGAAAFRGHAIDFVDELANLADFDEKLRRIGRNDEDVGMGLNEDASFAFVGFAKIVPGGHSFGDASFEIGSLTDFFAIGADAAEVGEAGALAQVKAVRCLREHDGECVFAGAARTGKDERVGQAGGGDGFAQMANGRFIAEKVAKTHERRVQGTR